MDWASFAKMTKKYPGGRKALADEVGLTYHVLNKRINRKNLRVETFEKICKTLQIDPAYFLNKPPKKNNHPPSFFCLTLRLVFCMLYPHSKKDWICS